MTHKDNNHNFLKISLQEIDMPFRYHESYSHSLHWDARKKDTVNLDDIDLLSLEDMKQQLTSFETDLLTLQKLS
jgi:hypothetical protein